MGRKNQIEGQLNFLDMLIMEEVVEEAEELQDISLESSEDADAENNTAEKLFQSGVRSERMSRKKAPGSFPECTVCWCASCEHSTVGGSVPRAFGEAMRACPSCELCVSEGKADICVIGSADEGCRYRAEKEGLVEKV